MSHLDQDSARRIIGTLKPAQEYRIETFRRGGAGGFSFGLDRIAARFDHVEQITKAAEAIARVWIGGRP
jgi:hypothetical protein